jgi:hypothetical protein
MADEKHTAEPQDEQVEQADLEPGEEEADEVKGGGTRYGTPDRDGARYGTPDRDGIRHGS